MSAILARKWLDAIAVALAVLCWPTFSVLAPGSAAAQPAVAQLSPPPAGMARIWFLRQYEPGESLATPWIYINGAALTTSQPGTIFYRDLAPGNYTFSVESCGTDVNQTQTLQLVPDTQAELEIQSLRSFTPPDCPRGTSTFYVRPVAPHFLQLYLPQLAYLGGS